MNLNFRKDAPQPGEVRGDRGLEGAVREGCGAGGGQGLDAPLQRVHRLRRGAVQRKVPLQDEVRLQSVNWVSYQVQRRVSSLFIIMLLRCSCLVSSQWVIHYQIEICIIIKHLNKGYQMLRTFPGFPQCFA